MAPRHDGAYKGSNATVTDRNVTVEATRLIFEGLRKRNYECVTVADL